LFFILILVFAIVLSISKYVSLASITASSLCPVATFLLHYFVYGDSLSYSFLYTALALIMASVVVYMHKTNIIRLKNGNENKFSFKSKHSKG
jgi:glycerol-3-phosphate acyltransferase PlsY